MEIETIREKLHQIINTADDKELKSIYLLLEDQTAEKYDRWEDEEFLKELDERLKNYENGITKGVPWEEVKLKVINKLKIDM